MRSIVKYLWIFTMGLQNTIEYKFNFIISVLSTGFPILIQYYLWKTIFDNAEGKLVYGYTFPQLITYTVLAGIVAKFVATGFEYEITIDIKLGGLNKFMIQPVNYIRYRVAKFLGEKLVQMVIMGALTAGIIYLMNNYLGIPLNLNYIAMFVVTLILGLILNFLIFFCISTVTFWMAEISHLYEVVRILIIIASGGIFPLDIFGENIISGSKFFPFMYLTYFPINVLNGKAEPKDIILGIIVQCLWIFGFMKLLKALWKLGLNKYEAVGG